VAFSQQILIKLGNVYLNIENVVDCEKCGIKDALKWSQWRGTQGDLCSASRTGVNEDIQ
jgi:hypothetical protein